MSKTETLRQLTTATNEKRLARLAEQIETVHQSKSQSAEALAETLEPLAQAIAALTDETRETLVEIERTSNQQAAQFQKQIETAANKWEAAAAQAQGAADRLNQAGQRMEWIHYALAAMTGILSATLVTAFWIWLLPRTIENKLDPQAVADHLKPAVAAIVTDALKRSKSK